MHRHPSSRQPGESNELSNEPCSLGSDMQVKTQKAKLMHVLEKDIEFDNPEYGECTAIVDGMTLTQTLVVLSATFANLPEKKKVCLFPPSKTVDFVSDIYRGVSIKASECTWLGQSGTFLLKGPAIQIPKEWKTFLSNNENRTNLVQLILSEWKKKKNSRNWPKLFALEVLVTSRITCTKMTSRDAETAQSRVIVC